MGVTTSRTVGFRISPFLCCQATKAYNSVQPLSTRNLKGLLSRCILYRGCVQIGGPDATAEELAADVEAAVADNCEPIPRNATAWSQLRFHEGTLEQQQVLKRLHEFTSKSQHPHLTSPCLNV
eukprot:306569-Pelagomonas_calceolata.AAC.8